MVADAELIAAARSFAAEPIERGLVLQAIHPYTDENGAPLYWVIRYKHPETGEKWLRPLMHDGKRWLIRRPAYEEGTPLYNLAALKALPEATVFMVEGEACADALTRFIDDMLGLGDCYVVSTTGSNTSSDGGDLSPLAGRSVLIWPDRDSAGEVYAEKLTEQLGPMGATLAEIDAGAFDLPKGGDCVDWLAAHPNATLKDFLTLPRRNRQKSVGEAGAVGKVGQEGEGEEAYPSLIVECAADIEMKPVRWLWRGVAALGKITMLVGNPDLGKSTVLLYITATLTRGGSFPMQSEPVAPGSVVIFSAEDDISDTAKPRLTAMGADMARVHFVKGVNDFDRKERFVRRPMSMIGDLDLLAGALRRIGGVKVVIVDPITAYLDGIDSHKNAEVRGVLFALEELAREFDCAILAMNHLTKSAVSAGEPLLRVLGSLAFVAGPRLVQAVVRDPADRARRLFLPLKNNLGPKGDGYGFRFERVELGKGVEGSRILWEDAPVKHDIEEVFGSANAERDDDKGSELADAVAFLKELLADGPAPSKDVLEECAAYGYSLRTLRRAQKELRTVAKKTGKDYFLHLPKEKEAAAAG